MSYTLAAILLILALLLAAVEAVRVTFFWKGHFHQPESWPTVSILVAARNESVYLPRLLASLERLDYPKELLEFLIINDASEDQTGELISNWSAAHANRMDFHLNENESNNQGKNGKAIALALLCKQATGEFLFFTDADCEVSEGWIKSGIAAFMPQTGIVIGITKVEGSSFFSKFQELEWWNTLGQVKIAADLGLQTTGLGNNMVIRKKAYDQSGGFELTVKSLTEDLAIARLIHQAGFKLSHQINPGMLAVTKAEPSLQSLLQQRKRWFSGVLTLPIFWLLLLNIQFLFLPALLLFSFHFPLVGLSIFLIKIILHGSLIQVLLSKTGQKVSWIYFLFFDYYSFLINALTILYYFYPAKIRWKSRIYS